MLVNQGEKSIYTHDTTNTTRLANMGCIIKLANLVKLNNLDSVEADDVFDSNWKAFVEGELDASNKKDKMTLGGAQNANEFSDEDEPQ